MIIVVDVDSTIYPLLDAMREVSAIDEIRYENCHSWEQLFDHCGGEERAREIFREAMSFEVMRRVGLYAGAVEVLRGLQDDGARLVIATDRPSELRPDMLQLLEHEGLAPDRLYVGRHRRIDICRQEAAVMLIDDRPDSLDHAHRAGIAVATRPYLYNHAVRQRHSIPASECWWELGSIIRVEVGLS